MITDLSDARLKKNIHRYQNVLAKVASLNDYTYQWNDESKNQTMQVGFIAKEIEKCFQI